MVEKGSQKLYMKWWFWVIIGIISIYVIAALMPTQDCGELEEDLIECGETIDSLLDTWDDYDKAIEDYCELNPENELCEALVG